MKNKKGAEMTIGTLVIIVLAVIVLVVIVFGFTGGWGNFTSRIADYFSSVNVDSVKQACEFACSSNSVYDYCSRLRDVVIEGQDKKKDAKTCKQITCYGLVTDPLCGKPSRGFEACDKITCVDAKPCTGVDSLGGNWKVNCDPGENILNSKVGARTDRTEAQKGLPFCCSPPPKSS